MKQKLLKTMLLLCALIVGGVNSVWADSYTLTPDNSSTGSSSTAYITTLTEFTYEGISWKMNQWNPKTLQVKTNQSSAASEFRFYNTSAFPGKITKVVITFSALTVSNTSGFMFKGGTSEVSTTTGGTSGTWNSGDKTITWTPNNSDNFTYFAFYQNGKVASGSNYLSATDAIVVSYESPLTNHILTYSATNGSIAGVDAGSNAVASGGAVAEAATVTLTATPDDGYEFSSWEVSGTGSTLSSTSTNPTTFTMGTTDATVTANFVEADNRSEAELSYTNASESAVIAGGTTHKQTLNNPHNLEVTYSSSDETIATVALDGTVTIKKAGEVTITASFAGDVSYKPGDASYTLIITDKYVANLVFDEDAIEKLTTDAAFTNEYSTDPVGIGVLFSSSNNSVATVNSTTGEVTIVGAGTTTISATINDDDYEATEFTYTLTVNKADAPISFSAATAEVALDETESFEAPTLSNPQSLTITWTSSDETVATINSSGVISFLKAGETTITATSTENDTYKSGAVSYTLTVNKAAETLPFSHTFTSGTGFGDFTTSASGIWTTHSTYGAVAQGSTEGHWLYSPIINLTDETAATLTFSHACNGVTTPLTDKATLWVKEVGGDWEKLTLTYSTNNNWTYVDQEIPLNTYCGKKIQLGFKYISSNTTGKWEIKNFSIADNRVVAPISFTDATVYKLLSDAGTYTGQALTNEESLIVNYASSNTDVATVNASTGVVTIKAVGETDITATYAETADYKANTATYKLVVSAKAAAAIEYAEDAATKKITLGTYTHTLTNPNSLEGITYTSSDETVATVNASTGEVTMLKVGETTITATFTENEDYEGAVVSYTLTVIKDDPTLSFAKTSVNAGLADGTYTQAVTTTPADLPVTYSSSDETVGTVASDGTVTLLKTGSTTITATFAGNASYNSVNTSYTLNVVVDYATLPFAYDGNGTGVLPTGFTCEGLGTYASSPKMQFNSTGDWAILKIAEAPGTLTFDIKGNSFSGGTFKVQTSVDGETYTDLKSYTSLGNTQSEEFTNLNENVRYIKWVYTYKSSGNVALGNIGLQKAPPATPTFSEAEGEYDEALEVTISCATDGASIYYTIDGSTPTSSSTSYSSAISITETTTLKAIAIKNDVESTVVSATYTMNRPAAPTFDVAECVFDAAFDLHLSTETDGATIYYTTDDTTPTSSSSTYSDKVAVSAETTTVKAIAVKNGLTSDVASATYTYDSRITPTFTLSTTSLDLKVNDTSDAVTLTTNSDGDITFSCADAHVTLTGTGNSRNISANAAGTYTVNVSVTGSATYKDAAGTITINVTKKATTMAIETVFDDGKDLYTASEGLIEGTVKYNDDALSPQPTVTYTSSDETVATVNEDGEITFLKAGTTTLTVSYAGDDEYEECETTYELTLVDTTPQETEVTISFASGLVENSTDKTWTKETANVTAIYAKAAGSNTYTSSQIRLYPKNTLTITAPDNYVLTDIVFVEPSSKQWDNNPSANVGTYTPSTKSWSGNNSSVIFTGTGSTGHCRIVGLTVTLAETVTVGSAGYTTYVTKQKVSFPDGVTGYIATANSSETVTLTSKESVPVGTPVVLKAEAGTYALPAIKTTPEDVTGNLLEASDGSVTGDGSTIFALGVGKTGDNVGKVGFYLVGDGVTVPAGKAYLEIPGASVKGFSFVFEDDPDSIEDIEHSTLNIENSIYDLSGRKINGQSSMVNGQLPKGIYIVNGKKVMVK